MTAPNPAFATLADGNGSWLYFAAPVQRDAIYNWDELAPWWRRLATAKDNLWRVVYISFEAAAHGLGLSQTRQRPGILAATWKCEPPTPTRHTPTLPPRLNWVPEYDAPAHAAAVERIRAAIAAGEIYQANLTFRLYATAPHPLPTTAVIADTVPPWAANLHDPELELWSWSPECFLRFDLKRRTATSSPIKGTATAGEFTALTASAKEYAEHVMIVDMARNDLGRVAAPGSVRVDPMFAPLSLSYAVHAVSDVHAVLDPSVDAATLLQATLPAASISGAPKRNACAWIAAVEPSPRGPYTGVLGWIAPDGRGAFSVLIRTVWRDAAGWAYGTGGGIVADSDPECEYAEALLKMRPLNLDR